MANKGYVLLHRQLLDNILWTSTEAFTMRDAWVDLILKANHADNKIVVEKMPVTVKRGQLWTSQKSLAARWRWSIGKTRRYLTLLQNEDMLKVKPMKYGTLLTIVKYSVFQELRNADGNTDGNHDGNTDGIQTINGNECRNNENKKEGGDGLQ